MTRVTERRVLACFLAGLVVIFGAWSLALSPVARLVPLAVSIATLGFFVVELVRVRRPAGSDHLGPRLRWSAIASAKAEDPALRRTEIGAIGWLAAMIASSLVLGLAVGLPLYLLSDLRLRGRQSWMGAIASAAVLWIILDVLLGRLLGVPLYAGWLRT